MNNKVCICCGDENIYSKQMCKRCYNKSYREANKDYWKQHWKQYSKKIKGKFIYIMLDVEGNILYIGSCSYIANRINKHLTGHSQLKLKWEDWQRLGYSHTVVYRIDDITRDELYMLEGALIYDLKPKITTLIPKFKESVSNERLFELVQIYEDIETFKIDEKYKKAI